MDKRTRIIILFGFISTILAFGVSYVFGAPLFNAQRSIVPEADNQFYISTTSPSNLRYFNITLGTGTSTAANGFNLSAGCFAINGTCVGGGGSGNLTGSGSAGRVAFWDGGTSLTSDTSFLFDAASDQFTASYASTTALSATNIYGTGSSTLNILNVNTCNGCGTGLTSLNGLLGSSQTFVDDTNVTMVSAGTTHTLTWVGTLADSRVANDITLTNITQITNRDIVNLTTAAGAGAVYFSSGSVPAVDATNLIFNDSLNRLTATYASSTALTATYASSTALTADNLFSTNASSTYLSTSQNIIAGNTLIVPNLTSALTLTGATGIFAEYAGTSCTNQFPRSLSALGAATCASVSLTGDITGTLAVGNGGTGATSYTTGSVIFSNGTILTEDNTNLIFNDSLNRLTATYASSTALTTTYASSTALTATNLFSTLFTTSYASTTALGITGNLYGKYASTTFLTTTYASSTALTATNLFSTNASSTYLSTSQNVIVGNSLVVPGIVSAIPLTSAGGVFSAYTGTSCTNQFVRSLSALGVATCATVGAADVSLANLTATNGTLTFSGTYDGSTARTIGLNLGSSNEWTASTTIPTLNVNTGLFGSTTIQTLNVNACTGCGGGTLSGSGSSKFVSKWTNTTVLGNSSIFDDGLFVGIGTSTPLTTAQRTLSVYGSTTIQTWEDVPTAFQILNAATSTAFVVNTVNTSVGIGTSTPFAVLSVNAPAATTSFIVGSSTATYFIIDPFGMVGIGTTKPTAILHVQKTLPAVTTVGQDGLLFDITSAGSSAFAQRAGTFNLNDGYTGSANTAIFNLNNNVTGGTGSNYGAWGYAGSGNSVGKFIGLRGTGGNSNASGVSIGGYFEASYNAAPTFVSAALIADNNVTTKDIFVARDNGTSMFSIINGGNVGLGSTTPWIRLGVSGTVESANYQATTTSPNYFLGNTGIGTSTIRSQSNMATGVNWKLAVYGSTTIQTWQNVPTAFQILNAATTSVFTVDTVSGSTSIMGLLNAQGKIFAPGLTQSAANQTYYLCGAANTFEMIWDTTTCLVSAAKFKTNIIPINVGLGEVLQLRPVNYYSKNPMGVNDKVQQFGFIADEVEKIDKRLVTYDAHGEIHGFRYEQFTAVITSAIQEFYKEFQSLIIRIVGLEKRMDQLEQRLNQQQKEIDELKLRLKP